MCIVRVPINKHYGIGCLPVPITITFPWACSSLSVGSKIKLWLCAGLQVPSDSVFEVEAEQPINSVYIAASGL